MRIIKVCPGIGDNIWLIQKLINAKEKFHFKISGSLPNRGKPLFDLLPIVCEGSEYVSHIPYKKLNSDNIQNKKKKWLQITEKEFTLSANQHLESGLHIEQFLPDLQTSYRLYYATTEEDNTIAANILSSNSTRYIGIYCSAYSNARHWNGWGKDEWFKFIRLLYSRCKDFNFVIIGAEYDIDLSETLMNELKEYNIPYTNTIGQPLSVVVELLKRLSYFVGFPSGLSIINEMLSKDGVMFYPPKLQKLINTWADPARITSGQYKGCLFTEPEKIFDWVKNEYCLFKKLS